MKKKTKTSGKQSTVNPKLEPMRFQAEMQEAIRLAERSQWAAADAICKNIVAQQPEHVDAINMLGVVAIKRGDYRLAVQIMQRLIHVRRDYLNAYINLGMVLRELGEHEEAVRYCREALTIQPHCAEAYSNMGNALQAMRRYPEAVEAYQRALALRPGYPDALNNLAIAQRLNGFAAPVPGFNPVNVAPSSSLPQPVQPSSNEARALSQAGRISEAEAVCRDVLRRNPNDAAALRVLLDIFSTRQNIAGQLEILERLLGLEPENAAVACNLGSLLLGEERHDDAARLSARALQIDPSMAEAHNNLGLALCALNQPAQAVECYCRALEIKPNMAEAWANMGIAARELGLFAEAVEQLRRAITLQPHHADYHYQLGHTLLHLGQFAEGWAEYEWRRQIPKHRLEPIPEPTWAGQPLVGKTLLVHPEQGMGDALQFVRYLPRLKALGATVVMRCYPPLLRLLETVEGLDRIVEWSEPLPHADWHVSLLSLPGLLHRDDDPTPTPAAPYVCAEDAGVRRWAERMAIFGGLKVGLVWAGNPDNKNDRLRSLRLSDYAPFAAAEGVTFFSLQKGPAGSQAATPPEGMSLVDWTDELHAFADTAALIANLDLVISVDTAAVHLAGAMGVPVWTLIHFPPDWRWLLDREDSPWYPTMRLFRQPKSRDWRPVIENVKLALLQRLPGC